MIDENNIEWYIIRLIEQDLLPDEERALSEFIKRNPTFEEMLDDYRHTVLVAPEVNYPDKTELYRHTNDQSFIMLHYLWKAAAVLLFIITVLSSVFYFVYRYDNHNGLASNKVMPETTNRISSVNTPVQSSNTLDSIISGNKITSAQKQVITAINTVIHNDQPVEIKPVEHIFNEAVTFNPDTTLYVETIGMFNQDNLTTQNTIHAEPNLKAMTDKSNMKKRHKGIERISHLLRRKGKNGLANSIEYLADIRDKEIEISYTSRIITFQKSFSLNKFQ